jgi:hypothetical protein
MKRRTFLRGMAAAVAIGMAPAFLNATRLRLAEPIRRSYRFAAGTISGNISEIGVNGMAEPAEWTAGAQVGTGYQRIELPQTITVLADESLDVNYTHYADGRKPEISLTINA